MPILGILFIILSSGLTGMLITGIFRERNSNFAVTVSAGFLSLFAFLMVCVLAGLKLDLSLRTLSLTYLGVVSLTSIAGMFLALRREFVKPDIKPDKKLTVFLLLSLVTGVVSFLILNQSYINDDLIEMVYTSVSTDTYYEYASLTGQKMVNGLPIFNKVYVMPVFFTVMCKIFGLNPFIGAGIVIPVMVYVLNLSLVYLIAVEIKTESVNLFMSLYIVWLICGTYLPRFGIPVTWGYAILRNGYSGYAVFYGVLIPLLILLLLKKKYIMAVAAAIPALSLVRIDRIFYALTDPINSYRAIVSAGKLFALYFIAIIAAYAFSKTKGIKDSAGLLLAPGIYTVNIIVHIFDLVKPGKERKLLICGAIIVMAACVNFTPFEGAETLINSVSEQSKVNESLALITAEYPDCIIYSTPDFMAMARTANGNVRVAYGRDFDSSYMAGFDYEDKSNDIRDFDYYMKNSLYSFNYLVTSKSGAEITKELAQDGINVAVFPGDFDISRVIDDFTAAGYEDRGLYGDYKVITLK